MKVENIFPPNYQLITSALPHVIYDKNAIFCYGDVIYNPYGRDITPDVKVHESVHSKQQGSDVDGWYMKYLSDPQFRLEQEIEAYGEQYRWICANIDAHVSEGAKLPVTRIKEHALRDMSFSLSSATYGRIISLGEAMSKIKNY